VQVPAFNEDRGEVVAVDGLVNIGSRIARVAEPVDAKPLNHFGSDASLLAARQGAVVVSG
jgi:hypothetical protein